MIGVTINGKHSYYDFGALLADVTEDFPEVLQVTESVPYSGEVYDFTALYGVPVLMRRDVYFKFKFMHESPLMNKLQLARFLEFIYSLSGDVDIFIDGSDFHWTGRRTAVTNLPETVGYEYGARMVEVCFSCKPKRQANAAGMTPEEVI